MKRKICEKKNRKSIINDIDNDTEIQANKIPNTNGIEIPNKKIRTNVTNKKIRSSLTNPLGLNKKPWPILMPENTICVDECGCGAFSGPLSVCAVYLKPEFSLNGLHDSKLLQEHEREVNYELLTKDPNIYFYVEHMTNIELDEVGGLGKAWQMACTRAVEKLTNILRANNIEPLQVILDGNKKMQTCEFPVTCVVQADSKYIGVAAASILAKVERDRYMVSIAPNYPIFEEIFKKGKGYWYNQKHSDLIDQGIFTDLHRKTYKPLKTYLSKMMHLNE